MCQVSHDINDVTHSYYGNFLVIFLYYFIRFHFVVFKHVYNVL
jgi:hypothetical protein